MENTKQRVIIYVDGFNFYYGLKAQKWQKYYWLDLVRFFESFCKPYQELVAVNYFSARHLIADKAKRQDAFFEANKTNPRFNLHLGKYLKKKIWCPNCQSFIETFEEKETDVRIAAQLIDDVVNTRCDISVIVSADSDLIPPIELIRNISPGHKIYTYFPPKRHLFALQALSDNVINLEKSTSVFAKSLMPDVVMSLKDYPLQRPKNWK